MDWIFLTLLATILAASSNVFVKFILDKEIKDPIFYLLFNLVFLTPFYIIFLFLFTQITFSFFSLIPVLAGILFYISAYLFYEAIRIDEVSRVVPLVYTSTVFTMILSTIFLGEFFTFSKYVGIFLVFSGAFLISFEKSLKIRRGAYLTLISAFIVGIYNILFKYSLNFMNYTNAFFWGTLIGFSLIQIPILFKYNKKFFKMTKKLKKGIFIFLIAFGLIFIISRILFLSAMSLAPVALFSAVGASRPLFVLIFTIILSLFFPHIIKENLKKSLILLKIGASILIIVGIFLIA